MSTDQPRNVRIVIAPRHDHGSGEITLTTDKETAANLLIANFHCRRPWIERHLTDNSHVEIAIGLLTIKLTVFPFSLT